MEKFFRRNDDMKGLSFCGPYKDIFDLNSDASKQPLIFTTLSLTMGKGKKGSSSKKGTHIPAGTVPPTALELDVGSLKLTDKPNIAGDSHQCLEADGFDDGGVADLSLLIDLDDMVIRRKKGDEVYFAAKDEDTLPRVFNGGLKVR